jgi:hypothetical protein
MEMSLKGKQDPQKMAKASVAAEAIQKLGCSMQTCKEHSEHLEILNKNGKVIWSRHNALWPPSVNYLMRHLEDV